MPRRMEGGSGWSGAAATSSDQKGWNTFSPRASHRLHLQAVLSS